MFQSTYSGPEALHPYSYREVTHPYERHQLGGLTGSDRVYSNIHNGDTLVFREPSFARLPTFEYRPLNGSSTLCSYSSGPQFLRFPGDRI